MKNTRNKKIVELVNEQHIYASVLFYFGIEFYNYSDQTLEQVCRAKGLEASTVINKLERISEKKQEDDLKNIPIDLLVEYLKHSHHLFVKEKLAFVGKLVDQLHQENIDEPLLKDILLVFPLFVEDFIKHIYEEEDTIFNYILSLNTFKIKQKSYTAIIHLMEKSSLNKFYSEHHSQEDEMTGLRNITGNYDQSKAKSLCMKVIFTELQGFEQALELHAKIENAVLFPKALKLEKKVRLLIKQKISLN